MIKQLIDRVQNLFAESPFLGLLLIGFVLVMAQQSVIQVATWWARNIDRARICRWLDPSRFPEGSAWQERAELLLSWLESVAWAEAETETVDPLHSAHREYQVVGQVATGDLSHVDCARSDQEFYILKTSHLPGADELLEKEREILEGLQQRCRGSLYGEYFPKPVESFYWGPRFVVAYQWREGFHSAQEVFERHPRGVSGRHIGWMLNRVLEVLGFVHRLGLIHGAVLPPHLLFHTENHGLQLLGWIHAQRCQGALKIAPRRFKAWYPPECHRREGITPATDIYLAAMSMVWLAGGNPLDRSLPDHLPSAIGRLLQTCLHESPSQRPQDAWDLHEHFREQLEGAYGAPQFCHLNMS